jgi:hypothetical protein
MSAPSKNRLLQQATERGHIELFLELAHLNADLELGDRPDCVLVLPGGRIGLEHRELVDQSVRAHAPHLRRLEEMLLSELQMQELRVRVQVEFPGSYLVDHPREVRPLASRIAALASAARDLEMDELHALGIAGPRKLTFRAAASASVSVIGGPAEGGGMPSVVEAVRSKESKLDEYARDPRLSQLWLLLVAGDAGTRGEVRIESRFDRVYMLETFAPSLRCLKD